MSLEALRNFPDAFSFTYCVIFSSMSLTGHSLFCCSILRTEATEVASVFSLVTKPAQHTRALTERVRRRFVSIAQRGVARMSKLHKRRCLSTSQAAETRRSAVDFHWSFPHAMVLRATTSSLHLSIDMASNSPVSFR